MWDIASYLEKANKRWVREDEFRVNCPFCNDTKLHLYVNTSKQVYHCFRCNMSGRLHTKLFCFPPPTIFTRSRRTRQLTRVPITEEAISWLKRRGLTDSEIILFNPIMYAEYPHYVFCTASKAAQVGRNIRGGVPKYITLQRNSTLPWGYEYVNVPAEEVWVVEGVFDWFAVRRYNLPCVALLGKSFPKSYLTWVLTVGVKRVVLALDGDVLLQHIQKIVRTLVGYVTVKICVLENDPWEDRDKLPEMVLLDATEVMIL